MEGSPTRICARDQTRTGFPVSCFCLPPSILTPPIPPVAHPPQAPRRMATTSGSATTSAGANGALSAPPTILSFGGRAVVNGSIVPAGTGRPKIYWPSGPITPPAGEVAAAPPPRPDAPAPSPNCVFILCSSGTLDKPGELVWMKRKRPAAKKANLLAARTPLKPNTTYQCFMITLDDGGMQMPGARRGLVVKPGRGVGGRGPRGVPRFPWHPDVYAAALPAKGFQVQHLQFHCVDMGDQAADKGDDGDDDPAADTDDTTATTDPDDDDSSSTSSQGDEELT